jgi:hypothetical protein
MPRRTAVAAPAEEPNIEAMIKAFEKLSLTELSRVSVKLEELLLTRRLRAQQQPPRRPR